MQPRERRPPVALIGLACRFPGGNHDPQTFFANLCAGQDAVGDVPADRWNAAAFHSPRTGAPGKIRARHLGTVDDVYGFDADFFGISPREAVGMDPQQRMLLEVAWEALEDAGATALDGARFGVFVGIASDDYVRALSLPANRHRIDGYTNSGGALSIAANRISYCLNLKGPSLSVDTACSSSLVAFHLACQSLAAGECDRAIVAGVTAHLLPESSIGFSAAQMLAPDGRCRPFSADGQGFVRAEGCGAVVLAPLARALADRDRVYAVALATAVNQDGATDGLTHPSESSQAGLLAETCQLAGIAPHDVAYVEAHGTGTPVGDPIEARALGSVLGVGRPADRPLLVGSVKGNIGHLEAASGIAGVIKAALCLSRRRIPGSLHFAAPNPAIDFAGLRLEVVTRERDWPTERRIVGINSFGFGGTNAHAILAEAPAPAADPGPPAPGPWLLPISARSQAALAQLADAYAALGASRSVPELAWSAGTRRVHHARRVAAVIDNPDRLAAELRAAVARAPGGRARKLGFVFTGQGPQWWAMGRQLLATEPVFRDAVEACSAALLPHCGWRLTDEMSQPEDRSRITSHTSHGQPAIFGLQVGLLALFAHWGVRPSAVLGHSVGEVAAAYAAGAYDLATAARVIATRARLQQRAAGGKMAAVGLPLDAALELAARYPGLELAAENGPSSTVFAGDAEPITRMAADAEARGLFVRVLAVPCAFHSRHMDPIGAELLAELAHLRSLPPALPMVSSVTVAPVAANELSGAYWWRNVRDPVRFLPAFEVLLATGCDAVLELGPHPTLCAGMTEVGSDRGCLVLGTLDRKRPERAALLATLGRLYEAGCELAWPNVNPPARPIALPRMPWDHRPHRGEGEVTRAERAQPAPHPLLGRRPIPAVTLWQAQVDRRLQPWLDEHQVHGTTVVPGAALLDIAVAAGRDTELDAVVLERVRIEHALTVGADQTLTIETQVDDDRRFAIRTEATTHARGWVRPWRGRPRPTVDVAALRARLAPFPAAELYRQVTAAGLGYGRAFRCVVATWAGGNESLGELELPEDLAGEAAQYVLHPGLLDSAFQSMLAATPAFGGQVYLPQRVERFTVPAGAAPRRLFAHTTVRSASRVAVTVDLVLLTADGQPVAWLDGFRMVALREARTPTEKLVFGVDWAAKPLALTHLAPPELPRPAFPAALPEVALRERFCPLLDRLTLAVARRAVVGLTGSDAGFSDDALVAHAPEPMHRYLQGVVALLHRAGQLERGDGQWAWRGSPDDPAQIAERIAAVAGPTRDVELLSHVDRVLLSVCRGETDPVAALFEGEGGDVLTRFYREGVIARVYNRQVADLVAAAVAGQARGRPLRVLEVGGGTGSATAAILARVPDDAVYYCFTDLSAGFFDRMRAEHRHRGCLAFRTLDLELDPIAQGLVPEAFDLVVASNVVHATGDVRTALGHVHDLLAPGGQLVLLEVRDFPLGAVVFGLFKGWTRDFADGRRGSPLLSAAQWADRLADVGFAVELFGDDAAPFSALPATLAVATRRAAATRPRAFPGWRLYAEPGAALLAREVAARLAAERVEVQVSTGGLPELAREVDATGATGNVALLLAPAADDDPVAFTLAATAFTAALARRHDERTARRLVVTGAGLDGATAAGPWRSGVRGACRSLATEALGLALTVIDRDPAATLAAAADALIGELLGVDGEPEVRYRAGRREAERLDRLAGEVGERLAPLAPRWRTPCRVEITEPGLVENLRLRPTVRVAPGPREVEVEVRAAAINFNDAMFAQGLLHPEDNEPDFAGGALGRECTGVVSRVGADVRDYRVGDRVFASMIASMGTYATFPIELVRPLPAQLDFAPAATLPLVCVTVERALGDLARLGRGETVLIHGAAGGVGLAAIQYAQRVGATVFATAGTEDKRGYLRSIGVEHVLDSRSLAFADEVLDRTGGRGVDVVLNSLAGDGLRRSLDVTAEFGRFVEIGRRDMDLDTRLGMAPLLKGISIFPVELKHDIHRRPAVRRELFDRVAALMASGAYRPLPYKQFALADAQQAFAWMMMSKQIGKVVLTVEDARATEPAVDPAVLFRRDASYLVTGGTRGFGLAIAEWLAHNGAGTVILVSRRGVPDDQAPTIARMRAQGATVRELRADVGSAAEVRGLLAEIAAHHPPLAGVFHAAMVLDDVPLAAMTPAQAAAVIEPKVGGAWHLHRLTASLALDHFVLFSSIMGFFGNHGQAAYGAANSFLDALAAHRRAQGLPGLSVAWTHVAEVGYVAERSAVQDVISRRFGRGVTPKEAGAVLADLLQRDVAYALAGPIQWSRVFATMDSYASSTVLERFAHEGAGAGERTGLRDLAELPPARRTAVVLEFLTAELGKVTGVDRVPTDQPITRLGLDSLMAVELRGRLQKHLDVDVPTLELLRGPTLHELAATVLARYDAAAPTAGGERTPAWLARQPVARPRMRILCVPGFAETLDAFAGWRPGLPPDVELWTVGFNEAAVEHGAAALATVVAAIVGDLAPLIDGPFALVGNSMGALVAFELAAQLEARGQRPAHVFLRGFGPTSFAARGAQMIDDAERARAADVPRWGARLGMAPETIAELAANPQALDRTRRRLVGQLRLGASYAVGGRRLAAPICAIAAEHDESIGRDEVAQWRLHAPPDRFELVVQPGARHHFVRAADDGVVAPILARLAPPG